MAAKITINAERLEGTLHDYQPIEITKVVQADDEILWDETVRQYHYLGYEKMIGQRIKYLIHHNNKLIGAISFNRASQRLKTREDFIGWDAQQSDKHKKYIIIPLINRLDTRGWNPCP